MTAPASPGITTTTSRKRYTPPPRCSMERRAVGAILCVCSSVGLGLLIFFMSVRDTSTLPAWMWRGCDGTWILSSTSEYPHIPLSWTTNRTMGFGPLRFVFSSSYGPTQRQFLPFSSSVATNLATFLNAVYNLPDDVTSCSSMTISPQATSLLYVCNSTPLVDACPLFSAQKRKFLIPEEPPMFINLHYNWSISAFYKGGNDTSLYPNRSLQLGLCAYNSPMIFDQYPSNVSSGGTLAHLLRGIFGVDICGG